CARWDDGYYFDYW
nr:immunoglobulin heavy chain junction region [Mus musculus]